MVVITLEKCPLALRGDLTKWLQEISLGVYVGQVSARVRDHLWQRVCSESKNGRATMVFSARNEQHLSFCVHNTSWEAIDYDGLKLMMHPSPARTKKLSKKRVGCSKTAQYSNAYRVRRMTGLLSLKNYVVLDIETTGLDTDKDVIIEFGALRVSGGVIKDYFCALVNCGYAIPHKITKLTGITDEMLRSEGISLEEALESLLNFIGSSPIVAHNASFDCEFIQIACEECGFDDFDNEIIDTVKLAKQKLPLAPNYKLRTLANLLNLDNSNMHRAMIDCEITLNLFLKLIEI